MKAPTQLFAIQPPLTDAERIDALEQRVAQLEQERVASLLMREMQHRAIEKLNVRLGLAEAAIKTLEGAA